MEIMFLLLFSIGFLFLTIQYFVRIVEIAILYLATPVTAVRIANFENKDEKKEEEDGLR